MAPEPDLKVVIDDFDSAMRRFAEVTGRAFASVVLQNSRLLAWNLAYQTFPIGMDKAAQREGEGAIFRDVGHVFMPASVFFKQCKELDAKRAKAIYKAMKNGNYRLAEDLMKGLNWTGRNTPVGPLQPGFHQQSRNRYGAVSRHRAALIVPDSKSVKEYAKKVAQRVGIGKTGFISAGMDLGRVTKVPAWIRRHVGSGLGTGEDNTKRPDDPHAILHNKVRYSDAILHDEWRAYDIQEKKMLKHMEFVIEAVAAKNKLKYSGGSGESPPESVST